MTEQQFEHRKERAQKETWIISRTEEGFRIYSPAYPTKSYIVSDGPAGPTCTCPDFQHHEGGLQWRCKHILAVLNQVNKAKDQPSRPDPYDVEERLAIQNEGHLAEKREAQNQSNGASQMLIKRSISPDGRIDSLSIEFSCSVEKASVREIKSRAETTLQLQAEIVNRFLSRNRKDGGTPQRDNDSADGATLAQMLNVGGMDGKWGRRLFINVQANGKTIKFFGSKKQLAEFVATAGFPDHAKRIAEGVSLNLPCRVITKPSEDGKYLNIEKVLPTNGERRVKQ